jgi:hypothetical protein
MRLRRFLKGKLLEEVEEMTKHLAKNVDPNAEVYLCEDVDNQWISVGERLPGNERRVLILYRYKDSVKLTPFIGEYNPFEGYWRNMLNDVSIEYWAEIPEPPKETK